MAYSRSHDGSINTRTHMSCRLLPSRLLICAWFVCVQLCPAV